MRNSMIIALLIGASAAGVCAFNEYEHTYASKELDVLNELKKISDELKKIRAEKKAEQKDASKQHADISWRVHDRGTAGGRYRTRKRVVGKKILSIFHHDYDYRSAATPHEEEMLSRLDDKLAYLCSQIEDLDNLIENLDKNVDRMIARAKWITSRL